MSEWIVNNSIKDGLTVVVGQLIRCKDCKHRMHDKTCIKVMKRKPDDGYCDEGEVKQY